MERPLMAMKRTSGRSAAMSPDDPAADVGMFGRIFGLDGPETYRELRLEPLYCLTVQAEAAPHERGYPRRKEHL
jgi:hypothetical protein